MQDTTTFICRMMPRQENSGRAAWRCTRSKCFRPFRIQKPVANAEGPFQFQMGPMKQGLRRVWHGFGPFLEFFPIRGVACNEAFRDAGGSHGPPF